MLGIERSYYLWVLRSEAFEPEQIAFNAPFPNVYNDGKICWGSSNTPPEATPASARRAWEMFFSLPFNQDLATRKSKVCPNNVGEQLRTLAGTSAHSYPLDDLVTFDTLRISMVVDNILGA